jgi:hypothetical protein
MATRFNNKSVYRLGQAPLPTGYEKKDGLPDLHIPSCGIEDVDVAIFNLFDKEIVAEYGGVNSAPLTKVPVIFAAGEKWAMLKRGRPIRDRNNTLILPLITVMRSELNQTISDDVAGRGINQQVGEIVIRRKLDKSDRDYQALINRYLLPNQQNLAVPPESAQPGQVSSRNKLGDLAGTPEAKSGAYLTPNLMNNVYETVVVPTPQFYTAKYQITIWTQYTQHANQILEKIFSSLLPQAQSWRLDTPKGYWFVAKIEDGSLAVETNFDDMSTAERFIKHTFTVAVPAYFFASSAPGVPVPIKRYVSSPVVRFDTVTSDSELASSTTDSQYALGSDDPTLPLDLQKNSRKDQGNLGWRPQKVYPIVNDASADVPESVLIDQPAASTLPRGYAVKEVSKTSKGETVFSGASLGGLDIVITK